MKRNRVSSILAAGLLAGCATGIHLQPADMKNLQVPSDLQTSLDVVYNTDPTYSATAQSWIGRVGIVRAVKDPQTNNLTCNQKAKIDWVSDRVGNASSLDFTVASQGKRLRYKYVVDQSFAAKADVMSYLKNEFNGNWVFKVVLTEVISQRVNENDKWNAAMIAFRTSNKAAYYEPANICYVAFVAGYAYNLLTREKFVKMSSKNAVSYAGINVNGDYYNTSEEFALDDVFALSLIIDRRPSSMGGNDGVARTDDDRKLTPSDSAFLKAAAANSEQKLAPWTQDKPRP